MFQIGLDLTGLISGVGTPMLVLTGSRIGTWIWVVSKCRIAADREQISCLARTNGPDDCTNGDINISLC